MSSLLIPTAPPFLEAIPHHAADGLRKASILVRYDEGQMIHHRGEEKPGISIIKSGAVHVGVNGFDGNFLLTIILGTGQIFGEFTLFTELPRTHDAIAVGKTELYQIPQTRFMRFYDDEPEIARTLLNLSLHRMHTAFEMLDAIRRLSIVARTAKIIYLILPSYAQSYLPLRQKDLAQIVGVSRVSLNKALQELKEMGLVDLGYGELQVSDSAALKNWVEQNCQVETAR